MSDLKPNPVRYVLCTHGRLSFSIKSVIKSTSIKNNRRFVHYPDGNDSKVATIRFLYYYFSVLCNLFKDLFSFCLTATSVDVFAGKRMQRYGFFPNRQNF